MLKREIKLLITFLLLNTTISSAEVVSAYDLKTTNGKTQSYKTEELQKSLDKSKDASERERIYKQFADDVSSANYLGVKDSNGNYVEYDKVVKEYKEGKAKMVASGGGIDMTNIIHNHTKDFKNFGNKQNVDNKKSWKITFNHNVDRATMSGNNLKVVDSRGNDTDVVCEPDNGNLKVWNIKPRTEWKSGESYAIVMKRGITTNLTSHRGLTKDVVLQFSVKGSSSGSDTSGTSSSIKKDTVNIGGINSTGISLDNYPKNLYTPKELSDLISLYYQHEADKPDGQLYTKEKFKKRYLSSEATIAKFDDVLNLDSYKTIKGSTMDFSKAVDLNTGHFPYFRIYRPDLEKQVIEDVNNYRKSMGLGTLQYDPNLTAVAKYTVRYHREVETGGHFGTVSSVPFEKWGLNPYNGYIGSSITNCKDDKPAYLNSFNFEHKNDRTGTDNYMNDIKNWGESKDIIKCKKYTKIGVGIIHYSRNFSEDGADSQGTYCVILIDGEPTNVK